MNTLKGILLAIIMGGGFHLVKSQDFYADFNIGYSGSFAKQNLSGFESSRFSGDNLTYKKTNTSLGKGLHLKSAFGYHLSDFIDLELGISYLRGSTYEIESAITEEFFRNGQTIFEELGTIDFEMYGRVIKATPAIVFKTKMAGFSPYIKIGVIVATASLFIEETRIEDTLSLFTEVEFNEGVSIGFLTSCGVSIPLNQNLDLLMNLGITSLSINPRKGSLKRASANGKDILDQFTVSEKEIELEKEYSQPFGFEQEDSEPSKGLRRRWPFSSFTLNLGLRVNF